MRAVLLLVVVACGSAPDRVVPAAAPITAIAVDTHGAPRLLVASPEYRGPTGEPRTVAPRTVAQLAASWHVRTPPDLAATGAIAVRGGTVVRIAQSLDGMPIDRGELRVLTRDDGTLIAINGTLIDRDTPRTPARFALSDVAAIALAAGDRSVVQPGARAIHRWVHHDGGLIAAQIVEAYVGSPDSTSGDLIRVVISGDGRVLERRSLVDDAAFGYRVFADTAGELHPFDGPIEDVTPHPTGIPDGTYPGFVLPNLVTVDGLNHPANSAAPDPWLISGKTETSGNNVDAYADLNAPTGLTFGDFRATVTSAGVFDRTYDTAQGPLVDQDQQMASVTSLFFVINWLHDFWYDAGFVEAAGNAQDVNFGRGGEDRDAILAEAQDNALGGSRNNANMATPSDGLQPRMQVFLWSGLDDHTLAMHPSGRTPATGISLYGATTFDVSADVVLADDGAGVDVHDACDPLIGDVTGKIVLVHRGLCTFESKALRIQTAGGVGMIVSNNVPNTTPPTMGDDVNTTAPITIGQLSVTQDEGTAIETDLAAGTVTATLHRVLGPELDGAVDAPLIAHEFGHYLHHRLQDCTTRLCAAISEGWGDFDALMVMLRDGDNLDGVYPIAVYATRSFSDDAEYFGIRRAPYSVDVTKNAMSFRHMAAGEPLPTTHPLLQFGANNEVHNAGEIWAEMLWEAYVGLQREVGDFATARSKMAQIVVAGLLLAPVDATPTETRDALLIAARASSVADHDALAAGFARRGMGSCAVSPARDSTDFTGIVESSELHARIVATAPTIQAFEHCDADSVIDAGETGRVVLEISNLGAKPLVGGTVTVTSPTPGVHVTSAPTSLDLEPYATANLGFDVALDSGITTPLPGQFAIAITGPDTCADTTITADVRLNVDDLPASSQTDSFDTDSSVWTPTFVSIWHHERTSALEARWHGDAPGVAADSALISPPLVVGTDPVTLTLTHRFAFEIVNDVPRDAGVIEFSVDNGATWADVATLDPSIPYGATPIAGTGNALAGRVGLIGISPSFPNFDTLSLSFGTQLANQNVRIRFRIATDVSSASAGWVIDDVVFTGLANTPFPTQVADRTPCGDDITPPSDGGTDTPITFDGGGCCDAGPPRTQYAVIALFVIGLLLRRRRGSSE